MFRRHLPTHLQPRYSCSTMCCGCISQLPVAPVLFPLSKTGCSQQAITVIHDSIHIGCLPHQPPSHTAVQYVCLADQNHSQTPNSSRDSQTYLQDEALMILSRRAMVKMPSQFLQCNESSNGWTAASVEHTSPLILNFLIKNWFFCQIASRCCCSHNLIHQMTAVPVFIITFNQKSNGKMLVSVMNSRCPEASAPRAHITFDPHLTKTQLTKWGIPSTGVIILITYYSVSVSLILFHHQRSSPLSSCDSKNMNKYLNKTVSHTLAKDELRKTYHPCLSCQHRVHLAIAMKQW